MNENNMQHDAATGGNIPHPSAASDGTLPQDAETITSTLPHRAERTAEHTLTVRDIVRLFEVENIFVAERTITNWCHPNKSGTSRLDGFYDEQERRWMITPSSVHKILEEEKKKVRKGMNDLFVIEEEVSASFGSVPQKQNESAASGGNVQQEKENTFRTMPQEHSASHHERETVTEKRYDNSEEKIRELEEQLRQKEKEVFDLSVLNKGKDYFMDQMKATNSKLLDDMKETSELIGTLKTQLQIEAPKANNLHDSPSSSPRVFTVGEEH